MVTQSERMTSALSDRGPQRDKRDYDQRAPLRQEQVRADPVREEPVRVKKVRLRKNQASTAPLDIPLDVQRRILDNYGQVLMWATDNIKGQPAVQERQRYVVNAWEPVTPDMFGGELDGLYLPKGSKGEIVLDAAVLMYRPVELSLEAEAEDRMMARRSRAVQERQMSTGNIQGVDSDLLKPDRRSYLTSELSQIIPTPQE